MGEEPSGERSDPRKFVFVIQADSESGDDTSTNDLVDLVDSCSAEPEEASSRPDKE